MDWYKKNKPDGDYEGANDPGVKSVAAIYNYYKAYDYKTIVMGASFRSVSSIPFFIVLPHLSIPPVLSLSSLLLSLAHTNLLYTPAFLLKRRPLKSPP